MHESQVTSSADDSSRTRGGRLAHILTHRRLPLFLAALATLLALPSLGAGLLFDDYHHKLLMQVPDSPITVLKSPLDMFRFLDGDPVRNTFFRDLGFLPWWTDVRIKGGFWRPIASLTHWLDYMLWPNTPALMHAQSILWYALLVASVALLYRQLMGATLTAGLAALLYCFDHAHAMPIGFLANRNALIAALFGVLALAVHDHWRRTQWRLGMLIAPALLVLSLLAKEEGIAVLAYLAAYAIFLENVPWPRRLAALAPYLLVVIAWRLVWVHLGYGVDHLGLYIDPLREPARFFAAFVDRAPLLLLGQLATPPPDIDMFLSTNRHLYLWAGACLFLFVAAVAFRRIRHDRAMGFWIAGMLLSVPPAVTTFPSDRMFLFIGLGAMPLIAGFLVSILSRAKTVTFSKQGYTAFFTLAVFMIIIHLLIAPVALAVRCAVPLGPRRLLDRLYLTQLLDSAIEKQDLIIVNPPDAMALMRSPLVWASQHDPMPRHIRILSTSALQPVEVRRIDEQTLSVRPASGFLAGKLDRLWRDPRDPMREHERVRLPGVEIEVTQLTPDGRPAEAMFRFSVPLEHPSLRWLQWKRGEFIPFVPPPVGSSVTLPSSWRDLFAR